MQLLDGFIVGIYNYCDRWCETCPFTSRCRVFATSAELDASDDPVFVTLGAGLMRSVGAMNEALRAAAALGADLDGDDSLDEAATESLPEVVPDAPEIPASHEALKARAMTYGMRAAAWLQAHPRPEARPPDDAMGVVTWFHYMIGAKVGRALYGIADARAGDPYALSDTEGSAKVAIVGAERSRAAWLDLVAEGRVDTQDAAAFIDDLGAIIGELETLVPTARAFVRPGFDEPEAVARLFAEGARDT
jgi:hypothetical protein